VCAPGQCHDGASPNGVDCTYVNSPTTTTCDDDDTTTANDLCDGAGGCAGEEIVCPVDQCIADTSANGVNCNIIYSPAGTGCDDQDLATATDECNGAGICTGMTIACTPNQCHASASPNGVDCDYEALPAGDACDDGDAFTGDDICDGNGICAGTAIACAPTQCQESATPNGDNCDVVYKADGTPCDDNDGSTGADVCDGAGLCAGAPIVCTLGPCDLSVEPNGVNCTATPSPQGSSCDDSDPATFNDTCHIGGSCSGLPIICNELPCHQAGSPNGVDCDYDPEPVGVTCDDGDSTTNQDSCDGAGACAGTPIVCSDEACYGPGTPNGVDCDHTPMAAGTSCDDADLGTHTDLCDGNGTCAGEPITCNVGACELSNTPNGVDCTTEPLPDGTVCDDGSVCTTDDSCAAGSCEGGSPVDCGDGNDCTTDSCDPTAGCVYEDVEDACDDGNLCTLDESCQAGVCTPATEVECEDDNPCTADRCDEATGECVFAADALEGTECGAGAECSEGACVPSSSLGDATGSPDVPTVDPGSGSSGGCVAASTDPSSRNHTLLLYVLIILGFLSRRAVAGRPTSTRR
jgi:hypothetical protein